MYFQIFKAIADIESNTGYTEISLLSSGQRE